MTEKEHLVVIGNGMAGIRTVEELLKLSPEQYDITVFGAEPHPNYNRIMLSPVLAGEKTIDDIILNSLDWYEENYYSGSPLKDPAGPGSGTYRSVRGGSFRYGEASARTYARNEEKPDRKSDDIGFRCIKVPEKR